MALNRRDATAKLIFPAEATLRRYFRLWTAAVAALVIIFLRRWPTTAAAPKHTLWRITITAG